MSLKNIDIIYMLYDAPKYDYLNYIVNPRNTIVIYMRQRFDKCDHTDLISSYNHLRKILYDCSIKSFYCKYIYLFIQYIMSCVSVAFYFLIYYQLDTDLISINIIKLFTNNYGLLKLFGRDSI